MALKKVKSSEADDFTVKNLSLPNDKDPNLDKTKKTSSDNAERPTILESLFGALLGFGIPFVIFAIIIGIFYRYSDVSPQIAFAIAAVLSFVFFWVLDATNPYWVVWSKAIPIAIIFYYLVCQAWYIGFYERPTVENRTIITNDYLFQGDSLDVKDIYIPWQNYSLEGSYNCNYDLVCQQDTFKYRDNHGFYGNRLPNGPVYYRIIFYSKGSVEFKQK